jgi:hypothetical protein
MSSSSSDSSFDITVKNLGLDDVAGKSEVSDSSGTTESSGSDSSR